MWENFVSWACVPTGHYDKGDGNPHAHIMLTMRHKTRWLMGTEGKKIYALDEDGNRIPLIDPATGEQKLATNEKLWNALP